MCHPKRIQRADEVLSGSCHTVICARPIRLTAMHAYKEEGFVTGSRGFGEDETKTKTGSGSRCQTTGQSYRLTCEHRVHVRDV